MKFNVIVRMQYFNNKKRNSICNKKYILFKGNQRKYTKNNIRRTKKKNTESLYVCGCSTGTKHSKVRQNLNFNSYLETLSHF